MYAMKTQRGMEVLLHSVSTLALDEEDWSMSCSYHLTYLLHGAESFLRS